MRLWIVALIALLVIVIGVALVEAVSLGGQIALRGSPPDEIRWLEALEPLRVWDLGRHARIDARYRAWIERELRSGRIDLAVRAMGRARARAQSRGERPGAELVEIGLETYTRAADRMEHHGRLSQAADWDDTLFVFAVRDPEPRRRAAAAAAFLEGLGLRVRDGKPCDALARVTWARKGLGGQIPVLDPAVESSLAARCTEQRARGQGARQSEARNAR